MPITQTSTTTVWDDITTAALRVVQNRGVREQSFRKNQLIGAFDKKRKTFSGGQYLDVNIGSFGTSDYQSVEGFTPISMADQEGNTIARYRRHRGLGKVLIAETHIRDCDTDEKTYDLVTDKLNKGRMRVNDGVATQFWAATEVTSPQSIVGPRLAFPTDGGASATYAGITTANAVWRSQFNSTGGAAATVLVGYLDSMDYDASAGGSETWDMGCTTAAIHKALKQVARTYTSFNVNPTSPNSKRYADMGYDVVEWNHKPITWDIKCPTGHFYGFNLGSCYLAIPDDAAQTSHDGNSQGVGLAYEMDPWVPMLSAGMWARGTVLSTGCQFVVEERRLNFDISGLTT